MENTPPPRRAAVIVTAMIAVIGFADYLVGVRVSLALFYLVPISLGVGWLGLRAGLAAAVASIATRVVGDLAMGSYNHPVAAFWNRVMDLSVYGVLAWGLHALLTQWRELDERVRQRTAALEQAIAARDRLQSDLFEVSRRERNAIGHDLHDGLGQHLAATAIAANLLAGGLAAAAHPAAAAARTVGQMLQDGIAHTRQIARGLLLAEVAPGELVGELGELAAGFARDHRVACTFASHGEVTGLDVAASSHLYYIAQEAARNALRHAHPGRVELALAAGPDALTLTIVDNGSGLPAPAARGAGMGLRVMAHRAGLIGAEFTVAPTPGGGTRVRCVLPRLTAV